MLPQHLNRVVGREAFPSPAEVEPDARLQDAHLAAIGVELDVAGRGESDSFGNLLGCR